MRVHESIELKTIPEGQEITRTPAYKLGEKLFFLVNNKIVELQVLEIKAIYALCRIPNSTSEFKYRTEVSYTYTIGAEPGSSTSFKLNEFHGVYAASREKLIAKL